MARGMAPRRRVACGLLGGMCFVLLVATGVNRPAEKAIAGPPARPETVKLTRQGQRILDKAASILRKSSLSGAEQHVRLNAVKAVLTGTVGVPDDDNPEVRNPHLWTLVEDRYVVAGTSTAVEAIADLWTVHDNDGVPVPRIWCYQYASLVMAAAYVQYFQDTGNKAGLDAMNDLIGQKVFPVALPGEGDDLLWKTRRGHADLLPGDQVWFQNPYDRQGRELLRQHFYDAALADGKPAAEAMAISETATDSAAAGEQGSNVFYLGDNLVARGAVSVVRAFRGSRPGASPAAAAGYEQVYTQKIFTIPRFRQHIIDDFNTVQAYMEAHPGSVRPDDFQIKQVRSLVNPDACVQWGSDAERARRIDRLIDAMASRNKEPKLVECGDARSRGSPPTTTGRNKTACGRPCWLCCGPSPTRCGGGCENMAATSATS